MILDHVGTLHAGTGTGVPLCGAPRNPFAPMYLWDDEAATCARCREAMGLPPRIDRAGDALMAVFGLRRAPSIPRMPGYAMCCWKCTPEYPGMMLCGTCGNKRCPKATDCAFRCTNSNATGQEGVYE